MSLQVMLLDIWGIIASLLVAILIYYAGGELAMEYLALMFVFLICGTFVTVMGREKKEDMGIYEYGRSWQNVLANGLVPVAALLLNSPPAYFGALAAIAADKFSSEVGALGGEPVFLGNLKKVKRGTSGAVSALGTVAGFLGAEIVAISVYVLFPGVTFLQALLLPFAGLVGSGFDSIAGIFETRGIGGKATSNLAGAIGGALVGILIFSLVR